MQQREWVMQNLNPEEAVPALLEGPEFDSAILGMTEDNCLIYSRQRIVTMFAETLGQEDTEEWVSYNVERALPYMGPKAPLLVSEYRTDDL